MKSAYVHTMLLGAAGIALASCGDTTEDTAASEEAPVEEPLGDAEFGSSSQPTQAAAAPPQSCDEGAYCSGPLVVRSDNLTFSQDRGGWMNVVGTLTFENRSDQDLRVALMREDVVMNMDKGARLSQGNFNRITGLGHCTREGSECFNSTPDAFTLIGPGDSPAKVNVYLASNGRPDAALAPSLPEIAAGTMTLSAYTVAADGNRRLHRISLANVPVTNQLAQ